MVLYPLKFVPRFVEKMWGGRKIETVLGKKLSPGAQVGESWEIYDFPPGVLDASRERLSSPINNGSLAGRPLHWAVKEFGADLLGKVPLVGPHGQFPLLIKFLDARDDLSVQVHPDVEYAARNASAHLKTEAWYVMDHDPGARLFRGLKPGTTREMFAAAIANGSVEQYLTTIPAKVGQCHYLPSGTIHALGKGMLVAEVQTPSDTTFRVYDFKRVDPSSGKHRTLHVEQALECIDFSARTDAPPPRAPTAGAKRPLVESPYFKIARVKTPGGAEQKLPLGEPSIWIMLEGEVQIKVDGIRSPIRLIPGETVLVPAALKNPVLRTLTDSVWLEVTLPH